VGSAGVLIRGKQARPGLILAMIAATNLSGCRQTTDQRSKAAMPPAEPFKPVAAPLSDSSIPGGWRTCKPMTRGAEFAGTVALPDGRIFVISGRTTDNGKRKVTRAVRVYDPLRNAWTEASPIPTPRTEPGAAVGQDGKIYVMGGGDPQGRKNVVEAYDPGTDTWTRRKPMPTPREALRAVAAKAANGRVRIYAIGGRDRSSAGDNLRTVEAYDPVTDTWTARALMPTPRHALAATLGPDGRIYAMGGSNAAVFCTDVVEIYDPVKNAWTRGASMPFGRECAAAAFTPGPDGEVLVLAGWDRRSWPLASVAAYSPHTKRWRTLPPIPAAGAALGAVSRRGEDGAIHVYVLGGISRETEVDETTFLPAAARRQDRGRGDIKR
jgi:N-acetylneuraminic acid mutarotase